MIKKAITTLAAALALTGAAVADTKENPVDRSNAHLRTLGETKVTMLAGDRTFTITLYDNPTARDLISRLPMTLDANDYPGYDEKVLRLDAPLSMQDAPPGDDPKIPEVGYYEPGNWIALYYGPIGYWPGKVPLGQVDASVEELRAIPDGTTTTLEIAP